LFFDSQSDGIHWLALYESLRITVSVKNFFTVLLKKKKNTYLEWPEGEEITSKFSFLGELSI